MSFGTYIRLSSNAINQALGHSKAVVKDFAEAEGSTMMKQGIRWTFLIVLFAFGALAPQFAQEGPKDRELPDHQSSQHSLMAGFIRTMNTAEVK